MTIAVALIASAFATVARADDPLPVIATFSILGDVVHNVGGPRVSVTTLVGRDSDAHVYLPSPQDARRAAAAKLVFVNGLGFEGWIERLVRASGSKATLVVASKGAAQRRLEDADRHHADVDPHVWHAIANVRVYVENIRDALSRADPAGAPSYGERATAYLGKLDALENEVRTAIGDLPADRRKVITSHDAFGYFGAAYGIAFIAPQGVSTDSEPSARDVARIIAQIRRERIRAIFLDNIGDPRLLRRIAAETGASIGGRLYSDSLSGPGGPAATYIEMMRHNVRALTAALSS